MVVLTNHMQLRLWQRTGWVFINGSTQIDEGAGSVCVDMSSVCVCVCVRVRVCVCV